MAYVLDALDVPIVLAPMAGGPSTVELAAAACEAGALGFLAGALLTPAQLEAQVRELRAQADQAFGVNLFLFRPAEVDQDVLDDYLRRIEPDAARLGADVGEPTADDDAFDAKLALCVTERVPVVSFTFGCPDAAIVDVLHAVGSEAWVTVTRLEEARAALAAGADALVVQGGEAGGHRGSFDDDDRESRALLDVLAELRDALPEARLVGAGGVMSREDVMAVLDTGARAVQCGSAFLLADEAGTSDVHRAAVASERPTALTRAFTGRTARGVENEFMRRHRDAPSAYPQLHRATGPMRAAARAAGDPESTSLWAGTRHHLARPAPAREIVRHLSP